MKLILALFLLTLNLGIANSAIPDEVTDPATRDVIEYLDGKVNSAITSINNIGATIGSTVTVLGVANGGTGASTTAGARAGLGVPALDGTGAIGTWGINVTGNSATVTTNANLTGNVTSVGNATTIVSVPTTAVDLSTVTSALSGKLTSPATFYIVQTSDYLVNPATFYVVKTSDYLVAPASFTILTSGDNLGNHVATTTITANFGISSSTGINAGYYSIYGSTVLALLPSGFPNEPTSIGLGIYAGVANTTIDNTFIGVYAGSSTVAGNGNSFLGHKAGVSNFGGAYNTYIGRSSGRNNKNGDNNVFVGTLSGGTVAGSNNTFIGYYSGGTTLTTGSDNIYIGYITNSSATVTNNYLNIGNTIKGDMSVSSVSVMGAFSSPNICLNGDCKTAWPTGGSGGGASTDTVIDGSPIGSIIAHSTTTAPSGYLYCDGSYISTTTYSTLFSITGYRYSTYTVTGALFQLPDLRGMFLRGVDGGRGYDPESARVVGSTQTDTMQGHWHDIYRTNSVIGAAGTLMYAIGDGSGNTTKWSAGSNIVQGASTDGTNGTPRISTETRPENIAVAYMIKYAHVGAISISSSSYIVTSTNTWGGAQTFTNSVTVSSLTVTTMTVSNAISGAGIAPKIGTLTRVQNSANADVAYTGVGFKPSAVIFIAGVDTVPGISVGVDNGTNHYAGITATNSNFRPIGGYSIDREDYSSWSESGKILTMDSDGFTIRWEKGGTPPSATITVYYLAFR
jgi:microcystin-dependent protein